MEDKQNLSEIEKLKQENDKLKEKFRAKREVFLKVSQKGAVSLYGLGRFPVTLYKEQWEKLLERVDEIKSFIKENDSQLATKD
jgi:phage/plasmid-associated DNA primase